MGIISRLWREVWDAEQRVKDSAADQRFAEHVNYAEKVRQETKAMPTKLQTLAEKHGATREVYGQGIVPQVLQAQAGLTNAYQHALAQSLAQQAASQLQLFQQQVSQHAAVTQNVGNASVWGSGTSITNTAITTGGNYVNTPTTGTYAGTSGGTFPSGSTSRGSGYRHLGTLNRDTLFLALKGIEEAAIQAPKGNHSYDDQAVKLLDMRNFDGHTVNMLQLCSFCVSNCYDPNPLIQLLEGFGIKVEV